MIPYSLSSNVVIDIKVLYNLDTKQPHLHPTLIKQDSEQARYSKESQREITEKMSSLNFVWNDQTVNYVLREFDRGFTVFQIHEELVGAGYNVLPGTIEQTLRANGRNIDGPNPTARPTYISNNYGAPGHQGPWYNQPGNQITHQHLVRNDSYPSTWNAQGYDGFPLKSTEGRFAPQSNQGRHWDPQAASFAIEAHRSGQSVLQIWSDLRRRGYVVNAAQVAASLSAQGASGVHVVDYLGR